jgi:hypothetical protein
MSDWNYCAKYSISRDLYGTLTCNITCSYPIYPCNLSYACSSKTRILKHLMYTILIGTPIEHIWRSGISYLTTKKYEITTNASYHSVSMIIPLTCPYPRLYGHKQSVILNSAKTCMTCWNSSLQTRFYSSLLVNNFHHSIIIYLSISVPFEPSLDTINKFYVCTPCTYQ